jgi:hypothetical protein
VGRHYRSGQAAARSGQRIGYDQLRLAAARLKSAPHQFGVRRIIFHQ